MAFDRLKSEIAMLLVRMQDEPHDDHELALLIHGKLQELKAFGMPLPADLVGLEAALQSKLATRRRPSS